jgi:hypothetical protein
VEDRKLAPTALHFADICAGANRAHSQIEELGVRVGFDRQARSAGDSCAFGGVAKQCFSYSAAHGRGNHPKVIEVHPIRPGRDERVKAGHATFRAGEKCFMGADVGVSDGKLFPPVLEPGEGITPMRLGSEGNFAESGGVCRSGADNFHGPQLRTGDGPGKTG